QHRRRRRLGDERERAVFVDRDLGGHHGAALGFRSRVIGLAEVHDRDAVRTERGTERRRGRWRAGPDLNFDYCRNLSLRHLSFLQLGDVAELELDGRLTSEDVDEHLELRAIDVDLGDHTVEVCERPGDHTHLLAHFVLEARAHFLFALRALFLHTRTENVFHLAARQRSGLRAAPDEAGDTRRVAHDVPGVVVEIHAHKQVARENLLLHHNLAAVFELDDVFHRDDDFEDAVFHRHRAHAAGQVRLHLVLVARVRVHDVPTTRPVVGALLG